MSNFIGKENEINFIFCFSCENYKKENICKAFPKGIPDEIFNGEKEHVKPIEGQIGNYVLKRAA